MRGKVKKRAQEQKFLDRRASKRKGLQSRFWSIGLLL